MSLVFSSFASAAICLNSSCFCWAYASLMPAATLALASVSLRAYLSAAYKASANWLCRSLIVFSVLPRPSACSLMCNGTVYPALFFQLEIHAGTFQFF